jgi:hypothetical protein
MKPTTIAVDVAKSVLEVAVSDRPGRVCERRRLSRARFLPFLLNRPPATVVFEACGSAHHWGRQVQQLGHHVVLLPPHATRGYVPRNKTDQTDTKGLLEAFRNEDIHSVPVKSVAQQSLTALHRLRSTWIATRTARLNTVRGLLREFGIIIPLGAHHVIPQTARLLAEEESDVPEPLRPILRPGLPGDPRPRAAYRRDRISARRTGPSDPRRPPPPHHSRRWPLDRYRPRWLRRRRPEIPVRALLRQLSRPHAARALQRIPPPARKREQAR